MTIPEQIKSFSTDFVVKIIKCQRIVECMGEYSIFESLERKFYAKICLSVGCLQQSIFSELWKGNKLRCGLVQKLAVRLSIERNRFFIKKLVL